MCVYIASASNMFLIAQTLVALESEVLLIFKTIPPMNIGK